VLHEFAHQLDFENHATDGVPGLATREQQLAWSEVMRSEFASLRAADESGIPTLLNTYGATDPASFSPYRSKLSLSSRVLSAIVTQNYTQNCKTIFNKTRGIFRRAIAARMNYKALALRQQMRSAYLVVGQSSARRPPAWQRRARSDAPYHCLSTITKFSGATPYAGMKGASLALIRKLLLRLRYDPEIRFWRFQPCG
jgi:hypothetical protein